MADPDPKKAKDIALVHGPTEDGEGAKILRYRDGELSAGEVRPLREGQSIHDRELVRLKPVAGGPVCEVEVVHTTADRSRQGSGPARVSNDAYRRNWSQVFSRPKASAKGRRKKAEPDLNLN